MRMLFVFLMVLPYGLFASDYHVGPGHSFAAIADVRWDTLQPGDRVFIHWKSQPYQEKWVINRQGTAQNRIQIIGVNGPLGQQPVIDGNGAVTPTNLSYWNEDRGVIKIGGSSIPSDGLPSYISIINLEIRSGRPPFVFTDDNGNSDAYINNAAAIYIEKGEHIVIRNCTLHDCGNGIFIGAFNGLTQDILIEHNYIYDNGNVGSIYEHNTYTECINITYQYNRFGPLRSGAGGNNLKDRSAGLVVRYNWIESGNRQLDLVDAEGSQVLVNHPSYSSTYVYGNVLIEPDGAGNSQIVHYGGDSGTTADYRKGTLYFYNNTVISTRTGNTTLMRLSTNDESAEAFNNILYNSAAGNRFAMISGTGIFNLSHNWIKSGWKTCHCTPSGTLTNLGSNIEGNDPFFINFAQQNFQLQSQSLVINQGKSMPANVMPLHGITAAYGVHQQYADRKQWSAVDMGAFEYGTEGAHCASMTELIGGFWTNGNPTTQKSVFIHQIYDTNTLGSLSACSCKVLAGGHLNVAAQDSLTVNRELISEGSLTVDPQGILLVQDP